MIIEKTGYDIYLDMLRRNKAAAERLLSRAQSELNEAARKLAAWENSKA